MKSMLKLSFNLFALLIIQTHPAAAQVSAMSEKKLARDVIAKYLNVEDSHIGRAISRATEDINQSLEPRLWVGENNLSEDGEIVFEKEKHAAHELEKILFGCRAQQDILLAIRRLISADSILALTALQEARAVCSTSECQELIDQAISEIDKAENKLAKEQYTSVIESYKKAWSNAQEAMEEELESVGEGLNARSGIPTKYVVEQNYPNPFNPSTTIRYTLPEMSHVTLKLYNLLGQEIKTLVNQVQDAGYKSITFEISGLSTGIYYYRLEAKNFVETKKLIIAK